MEIPASKRKSGYGMLEKLHWDVGATRAANPDGGINSALPGGQRKTG